MPYSDPDKQAEYQRNWLQRKREAWLAGKSCVHCGDTKALEVDHVDPSQKVSHKIWSWSDIRRNAELAKCQVLCRSCHKTKSVSAIVRDPLGRFLRVEGGA